MRKLLTINIIDKWLTKKTLKAFFSVHFVTYFCVVAAAILSCSCQTHTATNPTVLQAEALLWHKPDSALLLLETLTKPELLPEADYATSCLVSEHARYKLSLPTSPDSITALAIDYFTKHPNAQYTGEAFYVQGAELAELGYNDRAITSLKQAENYLLKTENPNTQLMGLLYYVMGMCSEKEDLFHIALDYYRQAKDYFEQNKNNLYLACVYRDMGRSFDNPDSLTIYFKQAEKYAILAQDSNLYWSIKAFKTFEQYDQEKPESVIVNIYHNCNVQKYYTLAYPIAMAYLAMDSVDSCKHYLDLLALDTASLAWSKTNYRYLKSLYLKRINKTDSAFISLLNAYELREKEIENNAKARTFAIAKRYDLTKEKEQKMELQHNSDRKIIAIIIVSAALLIFAALSFIIILLLKHRNSIQSIKLQENRLHLYNMLKTKIECTKQLALDNNLKKHPINQLPESVRNTIQQMTYTGNSHEKLLDELQHLYPQFFIKLSDNKKLTNIDLLVICLLALNFTSADIIQLLWINPNAFHQRCSLIKLRINYSGNKLAPLCKKIMDESLNAK